MILRAWTGRASVGTILDACRKAGLDTTADEDNVYILVDGRGSKDAGIIAWETRRELRLKAGTDFALTFKPWPTRPAA